MTEISDVTVIGGGVIGLLTARELTLAGVTVTLVEKSDVGREASWAGGGILLPLYPWRQAEAISNLARQSLTLYPTLAADLKAAGLDPEWLPCGLLITRNPDAGAAVDWCRRYRVDCRPAETEQLRHINARAENPLWLPGIAQIRNPRLVQSLRRDAAARGVVIHTDCELKAVRRTGSRIAAIITGREEFKINELVICAGAWSGLLLPELLPAAPAPEIKPVKGEMLLFEADPGLLPCMVLDGDRYLIPRRDGKILAGSTVADAGFDKTPTNAARDDLTAFARALLPALKHCPVSRHWAGLRPGTPLGIPYIGRHPDIANLSLNAGHFRNGLVLGPASAQMMADIILNRPLSVPPEPYQWSARH